jgi:hypothetical protein
MNFKLKYQLLQTTELETALIIERIQSALNYRGYRIINLTEDSVQFDSNAWKLKWNFSPAMLDGGEFQITASNNQHAIHPELKYKRICKYT